MQRMPGLPGRFVSTALAVSLLFLGLFGCDSKAPASDPGTSDPTSKPASTQAAGNLPEVRYYVLSSA